MNNLFILLLIAACSASFLVKSQDCSPDEKHLRLVEIICAKVTNEKWSDAEFHLTCEGDNATTSNFPDSSVSSVLHSNRSEVANLPDIIGLSFREVTMKFIPLGIKFKLVNLKVLQIYDCGLLGINKENLQEFGSSLEGLHLQINKITSIDADLFAYNPNLKYIGLFDNPIRYIEPEFFTNLKHLKGLKFLDLETSSCMNQTFSAVENGHDITTFVWQNENCTDTTAHDETQNLFKTKCAHE